MKRILVPLDGSPLAEAILPVAEAVLRAASVPALLFKAGEQIEQ